MKASNSSEPIFPKAVSFNHELKNISAFDFLEALKPNLNDAYCITDEEGYIVNVNDKYCKALDYQESELLDQNFTILLPPEIRPYALMFHQEYIWEQSNENTTEWTYLSKSGTEKSFLTHISRLTFSEAKPYKLEVLLPSSEKSSDMEVMRKKMQHQFKNTLHEISGLIQLQSAQLEGEAKTAVLFSQKRITSIAFAFELLYKSNQADEIDLAEYLSGLGHKYQQEYDIEIDHESLYWPVDKVYALGIIITEFLNSKVDKSSEVLKLNIHAKIIGSTYILSLSADKPLNTKLSNFSNQLIQALGRQLFATIDIQNSNKEALRLECSL